MRTRILRSVMGSLYRAEDRQDHNIVPRLFPVKIARQLPLLHESAPFEDVLRAIVVIEHVDAQLHQVHVVEGEADQRADGIAAEAAVPGCRLADEESEPGVAR